jgi:ATP-dependent Clp protease ATP-binding subunit ClpB
MFAEGGADEAETDKMLQEALRATFRPEFLNRIDDIVIFHALTLDEIARIVELQLEAVRQRLAERRIELVLTGRRALALDGFDLLRRAPSSVPIHERVDA